jgi:hypothetical protein
MSSHDDRVGIFTIPGRTIKDYPKLAIELLSGCIVVRAEGMFHKDAIQYIAYHERFDVVEDGGEVPEYEITIKDLIGGKYHITWSKKNASTD